MSDCAPTALRLCCDFGLAVLRFFEDFNFVLRVGIGCLFFFYKMDNSWCGVLWWG